MIEIPKDKSIWVYGPKMINIKSAYVVSPEYSQLAALHTYMLMTMRRFNGIGLAAPQVGVFKQMVLIERTNGSILDMVNPEITRMYGKEIVGFEACLSVPSTGNGCDVPRMEYIQVEYQTVENPEKVKTITLRGMDAVVAQHEIDHLSGTFFFDRVGSSAKRKVLEQFQKWQKENRNAKDNTRLLAPCSV